MKKFMKLCITMTLALGILFSIACSEDKTPKTLGKFLANDLKNVTVKISGYVENTYKNEKESVNGELTALILINPNKYYEELNSELDAIYARKLFYAKNGGNFYEYYLENENEWHRNQINNNNYENEIENLMNNNGIIMFRALKAVDFENVDGWYLLKKLNYAKIDEWYPKDQIEFFKIKLENEMVIFESSVLSTYPDVDGNMMTHSFSFTYEFYNFGTTIITLPAVL